MTRRPRRCKNDASSSSTTSQTSSKATRRSFSHFTTQFRFSWYFPFFHHFAQDESIESFLADDPEPEKLKTLPKKQRKQFANFIRKSLQIKKPELHRRSDHAVHLQSAEILLSYLEDECAHFLLCFYLFVVVKRWQKTR